MEGHRNLTQYVQPMDLKGFLIQNVQHLLNVIKQLGLLKHSTEMSKIQFLLPAIVWIWAELCLSDNNIVSVFQYRFRPSGEGFFAWWVRHQAKSAETCYCDVFLQHEPESIQKSLWGVDYNGILVWRYCPSVPTEYNHMNQGCMAEQSTAEEMKDAWVVVAIVHLIRTEVSRQSEQTQEVILIKEIKT